MSDIKTLVVVDLAGNLDKQLQKNRKAISKFSRSGVRSLDAMDKKTRRLGHTFSKLSGRLTGAAVAYAAFKAAGKVVDFDADITRLRTDFQVSAKRIESIKAEIFKVANDPRVRLAPAALLAAVSRTIEMTGDDENTKKNILNMGLFMQATGTAGVDTGTMVGIAFKNMEKDVISATKVMEIMEIQYKQSLSGAVSIRDLARTGKGLISPVTAAVGSTPEVIIDATAVAQVTIDAAKSADIAAEAVKALMAALNKEEVQKKFRSAGVEFRQKDSKMLRLPSELIPEIFDVLEGDFAKLNKYFGESAVLVFQGFNKPGGRERLAKFAAMTGDGSVIRRDARINASTAKASLQSISNKGGDLSDSLFSDLTKDLAGAVDTFQSLDAATNAKAIAYAAFVTVGTLADMATGYGTLKAAFDYQLNKILHPKQDTAAPVVKRNNDLESARLEKSNDLPPIPRTPSGKIEIEVTDKRVRVKKIESDNLDMQVDTGMAMVSG